MANWNVYIPQKYEAGLQALAIEGESIGQVIKRLVLGLLDGEKPQIAAPSPDLLERIDKLETAIAAIDDRLNQVWGIYPDGVSEAQGHLDPDDLERLAKMIGDRLEIQKWENLFKDLHSLSLSNSNGLERVGERLKVLENSMGDRPTSLKNIPQGFTHLEFAKRIGSSERTVQRMAKDKERWPEGYHWSEESKKWFQLES